MKLAEQFSILDKSPNMNLETRIKRLKSLKSVMKSDTDKIVEALNADFGRRSSSETSVAEILTCINEINHTLKHIEAWVRPNVFNAGFKFMYSKNSIMPQPLGVVGIMSPWNYPFNLAIAPLVAAISAGNKVMIKPSEITPKTAMVLGNLLSKVFDKSEVVVCAGSIELSKEFSALPFKHLLFTGSTAVGKIIMQVAAANLTPVTLELGGKSPVIIDEKYNIKKAAKSIVAGKFYNAGQTCIAPDYILVNKNQKMSLIKAIENEISICYADALNNTDYTAIINSNHYQRLKLLADDCKKQYECVWPQGEMKDNKHNIFPPLLVIEPELGSQIMQNEIFGPILPIVSVESCDQAIDYIKENPNPLTLYLFSDRSKYIDKVLKNTLSGSAAINETLVHFAQDGLPFGGIGESGTGSYHGKNGFDSFSHKKSIYYQSKLNLNSLVRAPYTSFKKMVIKMMRSV